MKQGRIFVLLLLVAVLTLAAVEPALAGPGGKIARVMFETFWGKVLLAVLVIIFSPLIAYTVIKETLAERRAKKNLRYLAQDNPNFEWVNIKQRATDCFQRIHAAWSKEDVTEAAEFMTSWYWQNQQLVYLDKWEQEGLVNHCTVKRLSGMKPLFFSPRNDGKPHEGSLLSLSITATMQDYLAERGSGRMVEGSKKFKPVERIWTFTMTGGKWKVSGIEEGDMSLVYVKMMLELPVLEEAERAKDKA